MSEREERDMLARICESEADWVDSCAIGPLKGPQHQRATDLRRAAALLREQRDQQAAPEPDRTGDDANWLGWLADHFQDEIQAHRSKRLRRIAQHMRAPARQQDEADAASDLREWLHEWEVAVIHMSRQVRQSYDIVGSIRRAVRAEIAAARSRE